MYIFRIIKRQVTEENKRVFTRGREMKGDLKEKKNVETDSPPLYFSTKEQTKTWGHLITRVLDQVEKACRNKGREGRGHEVHLSVHACLCVWVCVSVLSGEGVKARKQVPIVERGVMKAVMRVWVSRAAHYKCTMAGPRRAEQSRGRVLGINEDRGARSR